MKTETAIAKTWAVVAKALALLATFLERLARAASSSSRVLDTAAVRARARATGVPVGAEVAGREWQATAALPTAAARQPPPIPAQAARPRPAPAATGRIAQAKADVEDWNAAIAAAKRNESEDQEWSAALAAARRGPERRPAPRLPPPRTTAARQARPPGRA